MIENSMNRYKIEGHVKSITMFRCDQLYQGISDAYLQKVLREFEAVNLVDEMWKDL